MAIDIAFSLANAKSSVVHPGGSSEHFIRCSSDWLSPNSHIVSDPSRYPHFTISTLVFATPALRLFIVFHKDHGRFPPGGGGRSSGGTGDSARSPPTRQ